MNASCEVTFSNLPDEARLWIIALEGAPEDLQSLLLEIQRFLEQWTSHNRPIRSAAMLKSNRFLLISGEIPGGAISGCGIDALMHSVEEISTDKNCRVLSPMLMYYRTKDGSVDFAPRNEFCKMVTQGLVSPETQVFNPGIHTLKELREGNFDLPLSRSVYARIFPIQATAT